MKYKGKQIPNFWWDFTDNTNSLIIQSDNDKYPIIAKVDLPEGDATNIIEKAERFIRNIVEGRLTIKQAMKRGI